MQLKALHGVHFQRLSWKHPGRGVSSLPHFRPQFSFFTSHCCTDDAVGEFMKETQTANQMVIGTKFAPLPWRQTPGSLVGACKKSLNRLGLQKTGLYIQHW